MKKIVTHPDPSEYSHIDVEKESEHRVLSNRERRTLRMRRKGVPGWEYTGLKHSQN